MDHYERLGITRAADAREVARAFRRAARHEHPDHGGDVERFRALEEAYRVLVHPDLRRAYDRDLDGRAPDWDDVAWGADVGRAGTDAGTGYAEQGGLDWEDDLGWGDGEPHGAPEGDEPPPVRAGGGHPHRLDAFVGGPVRLPDPLAPPRNVVPLSRAGARELAVGVGAAALAVAALATRWIAVGAAPAAAVDEDAATTPYAAVTVLVLALLLHVRSPQSSGGPALTWLLTAVAALAWFVDAAPLGMTGLVWASVVAGPLSVVLAVVWARLYHRRTRDPARLAALNRQNTGWRIDRHHRAEEWNRVRAALQVPGRALVIVGPVATDAAGWPMPRRRWTFDPRTGAQEVRLIGQTSPQGSWVVVDARGRVVATAPAWSMEAWLDALQESEQMSPQASTGART